MADAKIDVRLDSGQLQDRPDEILMLPGCDHDRLEPAAPAQSQHDREHLDRLRPGAHQHEHVALAARVTILLAHATLLDTRIGPPTFGKEPDREVE